MAFRKLLSALGVGAPEVETVLDSVAVRPGGELSGTVTVRGGTVDVAVDRLAVELVVRFEGHGQEARYLHRMAEQVPAAGFTLAAGEVRTERFAFVLPLTLPLTHAEGRPLKGAYCAVRTELAVDNAVDRGDLDEVQVHALPSQEAVLRSFAALGFRYEEAEVKPGTAHGSRQDTPWWQEIELAFPAGYRPGTLELLLQVLPEELDVRPGTSVPALTLRHEETADQAALTARLDAHLRAHFG
ncbi:sporulation protein [Streptomyces sp. NPDC097619]|uniref:sporulation protein n=1 Tax=Streptomyces sp. NPDC097619 TaxID=3157228 RepID=UPI003323F12C